MENSTAHFEYILKELSGYYSRFSHQSGKSVDKKIEGNNVKFDTYLETNTRSNEQCWHIFLHNKVHIKSTASYIKDNLSDLFVRQTFLYLPDRKSDRGKKMINEILKPTSVDFIQGIIKQISEQKIGSEFDRNHYIAPDAYVFPTVNLKSTNPDDGKTFDKQGDFVENYLAPWLESEESPVVIATGNGGIGKSTLAQFVSNEIIKLEEHTSKIFIDSIEAKKRLIKDQRFLEKEKLGLYDLYHASNENFDNALDELLFRYNLDSGNFFVIIDGIDELISKVDNFNIGFFLESIKTFNDHLKGVKVFITCRSRIWEKHKEENDLIENLELEPFTYYQAHRFFEQSFHSDVKRIEKAMDLAKDFHKNNQDEDLFHPYALDLIVRQVNQNIKVDDPVKTKYLNTKKVTADYIIAKICRRENYLNGEIRILDLDIDEQVLLFCALAIDKGNDGVEQSKLKVWIENERNSAVPDSLVEAFSTHPLLTVSNDNLVFKYDFLIEAFKSIYLKNYFHDEGDEDYFSSSDRLLSLLKICWFGSSLNSNVVERISDWNDTQLYNSQRLLETISISEIENPNTYYSGMLNICLEINISKKGNNKIENTRFLDELFSSNIENLCIENIPNNITFNFESRNFKNCSFKNYKAFWSCSMDRQTYFSNCSFEELGKRHSKAPLEIRFNRNIDKTCKPDSEFRLQFEFSKETDEQYKERVNLFVKKFVMFFFHGNRLIDEDIKDDDPRRKKNLARKYPSFGDINIKFDDFLDIITELGIVHRYMRKKTSTEKLGIAKEHQSDILKYIQEETPCQILIKLNKKLYDEIR